MNCEQEMFARVQEENTNEQYIVPVKCIKKFDLDVWNSKKQSSLKLKYFKVKFKNVNSDGTEVIEKRRALVLKISDSHGDLESGRFAAPPFHLRSNVTESDISTESDQYENSNKKKKKNMKNAEKEVTSKFEQEIMDFEEKENDTKNDANCKREEGKMIKKSCLNMRKICIKEEKENFEQKTVHTKNKSFNMKKENILKLQGEKNEVESGLQEQNFALNKQIVLEMQSKIFQLEQELNKYETLTKTLKDSCSKKEKRIQELEQQVACSYKRNEELEKALTEENVNVPSRMIMLNDTVPINKDKYDLLKVSDQDKASYFVGGLAELVFGEDILKSHSIQENKTPKKPCLDKTLLNAVHAGFLQWIEERRLTEMQQEIEKKKFFSYINCRRTTLTRKDLPSEERQHTNGLKRKNMKKETKKTKIMKENDQVDIDHPPSASPTLPELPIESVINSSSTSTTPLSYLDPSLATDPLSSTINDAQFSTKTGNNQLESSSQFTDNIEYLQYHQSSPPFTTSNNIQLTQSPIQHSNYLQSSSQLSTQHSQNLLLSSQSSNLAEIHEPSQHKQPLEYSLPSSQFTTIAEIHQPPLKQSPDST